MPILLSSGGWGMVVGPGRCGVGELRNAADVQRQRQLWRAASIRG